MYDKIKSWLESEVERIKNKRSVISNVNSAKLVLDGKLGLARQLLYFINEQEEKESEGLEAKAKTDKSILHYIDNEISNQQR